MGNNIVQVNVSVTNPPAPNTLQRTGAFISQGATTLAVDGKQLLTQFADLTAILTGAKALTSLTWSGSVVTATTTSPHGYTNADTVVLTIAGASPAGYNGTFSCTITGASTFTYPLVSDPGSETVPGTYLPEDVAELVAMTTTYFAQGSGNSVYVLELGAGTPAEGVTALTAYMAQNPNAFYNYLTPRSWGGESTFVTYCGTFTANTAKQYFTVTMTDGQYASFAALKSVMGWIENPNGVPVTEFSAAADFQVTLNYRPSSVNKVPPNSFAFLQGVTAFPTTGSGIAAKLAAYKTAGVNVVAPASEGGLSNNMVKWGTMMDGTPFNVWYSIDNVQINLDLNLANEVINGSNTSLNPLYYNQDGINRLQARGAATLATAATQGLALGQIVETQLPQAQFIANFNAGLYAGQTVINAEPFAVYTTENPNDYPDGVYGGLSAVYTPQRGFRSIIFNLNAINFA